MGLKIYDWAYETGRSLPFKCCLLGFMGMRSILSAFGVLFDCIFFIFFRGQIPKSELEVSSCVYRSCVNNAVFYFWHLTLQESRLSPNGERGAALNCRALYAS